MRNATPLCIETISAPEALRYIADDNVIEIGHGIIVLDEFQRVVEMFIGNGLPVSKSIRINSRGWTIGAARADTALEVAVGLEPRITDLEILAATSSAGDVQGPAGSVAVGELSQFANVNGKVIAGSGILAATMTAALADIVAIESKTDHLTVTQAVDLDVIEARVNALDAAVVLIGVWDASTGVFPGVGVAQAGYTYIVSVAGTVNGINFSVNDRILAIIDNASTVTYAANWLHLDYTDQVLSVAGLTGAITSPDLRTALGLGALALLNSVTATEISAAAVTTAKILDANVTYGKIQNISATDKILGRATAGAGITEEITCTAAGRALLDDADTVAQRATLQLGSASLYNTGTYANFLAGNAGYVIPSGEFWTASTELALTDAATITVNMSLFINASVTLAGNRTLDNPSNEKVGQSGCIRVVQDATGSRTLSYGTDWEFAGGTAPVLSTAANAQDLLFYHVLAANRVFISCAKGVI